MSNKWLVPYVNFPKEYSLLKPKIDKRLKQVFDSGRFILGPQLKEFESSMKTYLGTDYAIGLNSGTDAMELALKSINVGPGDEVVTVSNTFIATLSVIVHLGAIPILVDVKEDGNIDPVLLTKAFTPRTKALMIVHLSGKPCDMDLILANIPKGVILVEDACQSIGAMYGNQMVGTFGIGCFSFHPLKTLSAGGDGGMLVTSNEGLAHKVTLLRNHGTLDKNTYELFGYNSRLDEIQAAILNTKVDLLEKWIKKRIELNNIYRDALAKVPEVRLPVISKKGPSTYNSFVIRCEDRDNLKAYLEDKGIETFIHWNPPIHKQMKLPFELPITERLSKEVLSLPIHQYLSNNQILYISSNIKRFYGYY